MWCNLAFFIWHCHITAIDNDLWGESVVIIDKRWSEMLLDLYEVSASTWIDKKEAIVRKSERRALQEEERGRTNAPKPRSSLIGFQRKTGGWCDWISCLEEASRNKGKSHQTWGQKCLGHGKKHDFFFSAEGRVF